MKTIFKGTFIFIFSLGIMLFVFGWFFYWGNQDKIIEPPENSFVSKDEYDINYHKFGKTYDGENINIGKINNEDTFLTIDVPSNTYLKRVDLNLKGNVYYNSYDETGEVTNDTSKVDHYVNYYLVKNFALEFKLFDLTSDDKKSEFSISANSIYFENISYLKPITEWKEYTNLYVDNLNLHSKDIETGEYYNLKKLDLWLTRSRDYTDVSKVRGSYHLDYISANNNDDIDIKNDETQMKTFEYENEEMISSSDEYSNFDFYQTIYMK